MTGRARAGTAAPLVPERPALPSLRDAARGCRACDRWRTGVEDLRKVAGRLAG